jgi:predicted amidohydrolase YtcJ
VTDLILLNGRIRTLDPQHPRVSALGLRDGQVVLSGSDDEVRVGLPGAQVLDLEGRNVLPGLVDAHLHFDWYSLGLQQIDAETDSLEACLECVAARAQLLSKGEWITGLGWNQNAWGGEFPSAADLDRVAPEHPVLLRAKSGHAGWANTAAMRLAGITAGTANPATGEIQRDAHGMPTGILFEDAIGLVSDHIPEASPEAVAEAMRTTSTAGAASPPSSSSRSAASLACGWSSRSRCAIWRRPSGWVCDPASATIGCGSATSRSLWMGRWGRGRRP